MANTLKNLIHSTVVMKVGDTSKILFVLAVDRAANRAWVQLLNGAALKGTWDNIPEVCADFLSLLDTGVADKIIDIGRGQVFILSKDEIITYSHHTSKTMLGLYAGDEWTSTEVSSKEAYYCSKTVGEYEVGQKSEEHLIAPVIVLPADLETERKGNYNYLVCRSDIGGQGRIKVVDTPKVIGNSFKYNGSPLKPELIYDETNVTVVLPSDYTNVGRYMGRFVLKDKGKTQWSSGGTDDITFVWGITGTPITTGEISQKGRLVYNRKEQTPRWNNYDSSKMTIGGVTSATNCVPDGTKLGGFYTATFTPKPGYTWADGTTRTIEVKWRIERKPIKPPTAINTFYNGKPQKAKFDFHGEEEAIIEGKLYNTAGEFLEDIEIPQKGS